MRSHGACRTAGVRWRSPAAGMRVSSGHDCGSWDPPGPVPRVPAPPGAPAAPMLDWRFATGAPEVALSQGVPRPVGDDGRRPPTARRPDPGAQTGARMPDPRPAVHTEPAIRVLFTAAQIQERVREMGLELARSLSGRNPLYVGVLKGACMFQADLARATPVDLEMDFLAVASYGAGTVSSGNVQLIMDLRSDIRE